MLRQRSVRMLLVALVAFCVEAFISLTIRRPEPAYHDEYSYLLLADTFSQGRLTNPTHPFWPHFESFHILHEPSYQSKYPPAQGLFLALGQTLTGEPMVGLWLAWAGACTALFWMLSGFLPPRWALAGSALALVHPVMVAWWGQSYWGGAVPMMCSALVIGALGRLRLRPLRRHEVSFLAAGIIGLALSRPVEGGLLLLGIALVVFLWAHREARLRKRILHRRLWLPLGILLALGVLWTGYYHERVTGSPFTAPYQVWLSQYQGPEVDYRHAELRNYHGSANLTPTQKLRRLRFFYLTPACLLALLGLPFALTANRYRLAVLIILVLAAASVSFTRAWPHYLAPAAPLIILVTTRAWASLFHGLRRRLRMGASARWSIAGILVVQLSTFIFFYLHQEPAIWFPEWQTSRAEIGDFLEEREGCHLVFVQYEPSHDVHQEWVYNRAEIDQAHVVWARSMSSDENAALVQYFDDRQLWVVYADEKPARLERVVWTEATTLESEPDGKPSNLGTRNLK